MAAPTCPRSTTPSAGRRCIALALLALLSVISGCSDQPGSPGDAAPSAAASAAPGPVAGLRDVGEGVLLDVAVADGATVHTEPNVTAPYPEYEQLSPVFEVTVTEQPEQGARVALPTLRAFDPQTEIPLVFVADVAAGPWTPLPTQAVPGRSLVTATTPHFSYLFARLIPVDAIVAEANKIFQEATSGAFAEAPAPECPGQKQARTEGWTVASSGPDTLKWCFGADKSGRMLTVVNNRRYPLTVTHPGGQEQARTISAVEIANYSRFTTPGRTLLLPRDSVTYRMAGPARLTTEMDGLAQSLTALQTGAELAFAFVTKFGLVGDANKLLGAALQSSKCLTVLQDTSQAGRIIRDCLDTKAIITAFGPAGVFVAALLIVAPVVEFLRGSLNGLGDVLNGRDRYTVSVGYAKPAPPAAPPRLSVGGLGAARIGMAPEQVEQALSAAGMRPVQASDASDGGFCFTQIYKGAGVGEVMFVYSAESRELLLIDDGGWGTTSQPPLRTDRGIGVGSTVVQAREAYPEAVSTMEPGEFPVMSVVAGDMELELMVDIDAGSIYQLRTGSVETLSYEEICS